MSYDSSNLTTPDIKWLGVRPSDLDRFNIPQQCRLPMTDEDIKTGKRLVSAPGTDTRIFQLSGLCSCQGCQGIPLHGAGCLSVLPAVSDKVPDLYLNSVQGPV